MDATESAVRSQMPPEAETFLRGETGHTLLIKGKPRTGKTTFALQLANDIARPPTVFYIGTRGTNEPLYDKFPWLKGNDERDVALLREIESGASASAPAAPAGDRPKSARDLLESILKDSAQSLQAPTPTDRKFAIPTTRLEELLGTTTFPELSLVYRGISNLHPRRALLVLNRIDRLAAKYNIDSESLVRIMKKDLVDGARTNLVLVFNKWDTSMDHLADGVFTLKEFGGGMVFLGQLEINKLTGHDLKQNKYLFNILDGRFKLLQGIRHME